jgi:HlyD family secretion protein
MKNFFLNIKIYISTHKKTSIFIGLVIVVAGYFIIKALTSSAAPTAYVLGTTTRETVVSTVTSTGQVSTSATLDIKPQVSGKVVSVRVKAGDKIAQGQTMFVLDSSDASRAVRTAQTSVASAKLDLAVAQAAAKSSGSDEEKAVRNAYTALLSSGLQPQPADQSTANSQLPTLSGNYTLGKEGTITIKTYASFGGISFEASGLVSATGLTNSVTAQPIGNSGLYITFPSALKGGYIWTIDIPNKNSASYISNKNAYDTAVENQAKAMEPVSSTAVTLQSKQLALTQAQNNLADALETLSEYTVRAPFSGTVATMPTIVGNDASSGTSLATIITEQKIVTVSLNEVDVSKVKVGDKATFTFDAISDLTLTGTVATVNPVGTVTSGVVSYAVTVGFDAQDERVKSGMSVTVAIQTDIATDAITVPSSAVKTTNGSSYVLSVPAGAQSTPAATGQGVILETAPVRTPVETGITDGTVTVITSGLEEGQSIVTKTVTASTTAASTAATSRTSGGLLGGAGAGGATRAITR